MIEAGQIYVFISSLDFSIWQIIEQVGENEYDLKTLLTKSRLGEGEVGSYYINFINALTYCTKVSDKKEVVRKIFTI